MVSFIIPAHNEELLIGTTVLAIHRASANLSEPYEIIVVDDASTDSTAEIAASLGAVVVAVAHRQIAATRNAGAQRARGEILVFVDADTIIDHSVVNAALDVVRAGAVGGGALGVFEQPVPLFARIMVGLWVRIARFSKLTMGCCLFCTSSAFRAVGGFDESLYVFEDVALGRALGRVGTVVILQETVSTSSRNLRAHSPADALRMLGGLVRHGRRFFGSRRGLDYWYRARASAPSSIAATRPNEEL